MGAKDKPKANVRKKEKLPKTLEQAQPAGVAAEISAERLSRFFVQEPDKEGSIPFPGSPVEGN